MMPLIRQANRKCEPFLMKIEPSKPSRILKKEDFEKSKRPFVYLWKKGERNMYVGATHVGLARVLNHNVIGVLEPFEDDDEIFIFDVPDDEVYLIEAELISALKPVFNSIISQRSRHLEERTCPVCKVKFKQSRSWQVYCCNICARHKKCIV